MEGPKGQAKTGSDLSSSSSSVHGNMRVHADSLGSRGEAALKEPRVAARSSRIRTEECTGEACPLIGSIEDLRRPVREETKGKGTTSAPAHHSLLGAEGKTPSFFPVVGGRAGNDDEPPLPANPLGKSILL